MEQELSETREDQILADNLPKVPCASSLSTDAPRPWQIND